MAASRFSSWERSPEDKITNKKSMCRNIKTLHNFMPPATEDEVRASSLQFVRKLSGFTKPSKANEEAFDRAVEDVTRIAGITAFVEDASAAAGSRSGSR